MARNFIPEVLQSEIDQRCTDELIERIFTEVMDMLM